MILTGSSSRRTKKTHHLYSLLIATAFLTFFFSLRLSLSPLSLAVFFDDSSIKELFYARIRAPFSKNDDERPFWRALQYALALSIHNACELRVEAQGNVSAVQEHRDLKTTAILLKICQHRVLVPRER